MNELSSPSSSVKLVIENKLALILLGYDMKDQDVSEFDFWLTADPIDQDAFRIIESFCAVSRMFRTQEI